MAITESAATRLPDKVMDSLSAARSTLESQSDGWTATLEIATAVVVLGVLVEVVATWLEVNDERREGKPVKLHHILTFAGAGLIALAVAVEGAAEYKGSSIETALRSNNAASQGVLDKRAKDATAAAVQTAEKFGGLQNLVAQKEQGLTGAIDSLNEEEEKLRKAEGAAESELAKIRAREGERHLTKEQEESVVKALKPFPGTWYWVIPQSPETTPIQSKYTSPTSLRQFCQESPAGHLGGPYILTSPSSPTRAIP